MLKRYGSTAPLELFSFSDIEQLTDMACESAAVERGLLQSIAKIFSTGLSKDDGSPAVYASAAQVEKELEKKLENVTFRKAKW